MNYARHIPTFGKDLSWRTLSSSTRLGIWWMFLNSRILWLTGIGNREFSRGVSCVAIKQLYHISYFLENSHLTCYHDTFGLSSLPGRQRRSWISWGQAIRQPMGYYNSRLWPSHVAGLRYSGFFQDLLRSPGAEQSAPYSLFFVRLASWGYYDDVYHLANRGFGSSPWIAFKECQYFRIWQGKAVVSQLHVDGGEIVRALESNLCSYGTLP